MQYTSIKVPKNLAKRIEPILLEWGYRSLSEFVLESARIRVMKKW